MSIRVLNLVDLDNDISQYDLAKRMNTARDLGSHILRIIDSHSDKSKTTKILQQIHSVNELLLRNPFDCIEFSTDGLILDRDFLSFLKNDIGVSTICLQLYALDSKDNAKYHNWDSNLVFIPILCNEIKEFGFNLSLNIVATEWFDRYINHIDDLYNSLKYTFLADKIKIFQTNKSPCKIDFLKNIQAKYKIISLSDKYTYSEVLKNMYLIVNLEDEFVIDSKCKLYAIVSDSKFLLY